MSKVATAEVCLEGATPRFSGKGLWSTLLKSLAEFRCRLMHKSVSLPVHGRYRCWTCLQEYETDW